MDERVYFESPKVKVTELRVVFGHDTALIEKISAVDTNLRVISLYASFIFCLLSLGFFFVNAYYAMLVIGICFIWSRWEYEHYVELLVTVGTKRYKIASSSVSNRECIYKIADALSLAIADSKRRKQTPGLSETETMQLRRLLVHMDKVDVSGLEVNPRKGSVKPVPPPARDDSGGGAVDV
jgi:hypothetical protein